MLDLARLQGWRLPLSECPGRMDPGQIRETFLDGFRDRDRASMGGIPYSEAAHNFVYTALPNIHRNNETNGSMMTNIGLNHPPVAKAQFPLPPLPYAQDALAPYASAKTMSFDYGKQRQAYVDNAAMEHQGPGQPLTPKPNTHIYERQSL